MQNSATDIDRSASRSARRIILIESVLIGVFAVHAWSLLGKTPLSMKGRARLLSETNLALKFTGGKGLGIHGERIDVSVGPAPKRVAAFLLRSTSLHDDVGFWMEVAKLLPARSIVRLVAYCDGDACVQALRKSPETSTFPIIAYGEVVDSEAVLNADLQGAFVASDHAGSISWRTRGQTPETIVRELLQ